MKVPSNVTVAAVRATILKRKIAALSKELDEAKDIIRPWAQETYLAERQVDPELTMLEVPTDEGTLSVIFPSDKPDVIKGKELAMLATELPPAKSRLVVVQEYAIVKGFKENWLADEPKLFTQAERKVIERVICWKEQTPRIEPAK